MAWETVFDDGYLVLTRDRPRSLARYVRTSHAYPTLEQLERSHKALLAKLDELDRPRVGLIVDLRAAPGRNDPAFEEVLARVRPRIFERFGAVSVLVKSAAGRLQVGRHLANDMVRGLVTTAEDEALEHACTVGGPQSSPGLRTRP